MIRLSPAVEENPCFKANEKLYIVFLDLFSSVFLGVKIN